MLAVILQRATSIKSIADFFFAVGESMSYLKDSGET